MNEDVEKKRTILFDGNGQGESDYMLTVSELNKSRENQIKKETLERVSHFKVKQAIR